MSPEQLQDQAEATKVRGGRLLRHLENLFLRLDRAIESLIPAQYNPLTQTGAVATAAFLVAAVSGIALLIWYRPTVNQAYDSVQAMPYWGGLLRSLHRYSADLSIFFAFLHGLRLFSARRFTGARWLAWITGIGLLFLLWFVGWTGYWLVWDEPAQLIAQGSIRFIDLLPIFAEPLSRSFLADALVPPLLFFVLFFTHMVLPLALGTGLWLHISRVQRARFLTGKVLSMWTLGSLIALSILLPAKAQGPANLARAPENFSIDAWYMAPLILTERISAGALWALLAMGGTLVLTMPWWMRRQRTQVAKVNTKTCNGCTLCAHDCPYDAIVMVPRTDGRRYDMQARIDPLKCVGCGICAGACDSGAIGLDWLPVQATRRRIDEWIDKFTPKDSPEEGPIIAFLCGESAAARFRVNGQTGECAQLPGYRVVAVPCAGWVQPLSVERALRRGAKGVFIAGCSSHEPHFREGSRWIEMRLTGKRRPMLREDKVELNRIRQVVFDRTRPQDLLTEARRFKKSLGDNGPTPKNTSQSRSTTLRHSTGALLVATLFMGALGLGSVAPYPAPPTPGAELLFSLKHYGQQEEDCRVLTAQELASRPRHMQIQEECERRRADILFEVAVDDELLHREQLTPGGLAGDGVAVTIERWPLEPGPRSVVIRISDRSDGSWTFEEQFELLMRPGARQTILFDTGQGFRHFGDDSG